LRHPWSPFASCTTHSILDRETVFCRCWYHGTTAMLDEHLQHDMIATASLDGLVARLVEASTT